MWASQHAQGMPHMHGSVQVSLHMSWECPGTCKHQEKRVDQRIQNCEGKRWYSHGHTSPSGSYGMYRYACVDQLTISHIYHAKSSQSPWKGRDSLLPLTPTLHFSYPPPHTQYSVTTSLSSSLLHNLIPLHPSSLIQVDTY